MVQESAKWPDRICGPVHKAMLENLILIVDDQESDQALLSRMLTHLGIVNPSLWLMDGHEAIRYLDGDAPYDNRTRYPLPAVLFLDLKLPVVSGWDVLNRLQTLSCERAFRLFVYSEIKNVSEVRKVYALGADSFLTKPVKEVDLVNLLHHFPGCWQFQETGPANHFLASRVV